MKAPIILIDRNEIEGTPLVDLTGRRGRYLVEGESLGANMDIFYSRVLIGLQLQLERSTNSEIVFEFNLSHTNTLSLSGISGIVSYLNEIGKQKKVTVILRLSDKHLQSVGHHLVDRFRDIHFDVSDQI